MVYAYSAYGEATTLGPDSGNSLQYTGRENDGTGLYYYRARYYDPVLKRFVSEDPIRFDGGGLNFYTYVLDVPTMYTDPDGLKPKGKKPKWSGGDTGLAEAVAEALSPANVNFGNPLPGWPKEPKPSCFEWCGPQNSCPINIPPGATPSLFRPGCYWVCPPGQTMGPM